MNTSSGGNTSIDHQSPTSTPIKIDPAASQCGTSNMHNNDNLNIVGGGESINNLSSPNQSIITSSHSAPMPTHTIQSPIRQMTLPPPPPAIINQPKAEPADTVSHSVEFLNTERSAFSMSTSSATAATSSKHNGTNKNKTSSNTIDLAADTNRSRNNEATEAKGQSSLDVYTENLDDFSRFMHASASLPPEIKSSEHFLRLIGLCQQHSADVPSSSTSAFVKEECSEDQPESSTDEGAASSSCKGVSGSGKRKEAQSTTNGPEFSDRPSPFRLSDGHNVAQFMQLAADLHLNFTFNTSRAEPEFCLQCVSVNRMVALADMGHSVRVSDRTNINSTGDTISEECWRKADWAQFMWALRGKCQAALLGAGGED